MIYPIQHHPMSLTFYTIDGLQKTATLRSPQVRNSIVFLRTRKYNELRDLANDWLSSPLTAKLLQLIRATYVLWRHQYFVTFVVDNQPNNQNDARQYITTRYCIVYVQYAQGVPIQFHKHRIAFVRFSLHTVKVLLIDRLIGLNLIQTKLPHKRNFSLYKNQPLCHNLLRGGIMAIIGYAFVQNEMRSRFSFLTMHWVWLKAKLFTLLVLQEFRTHVSARTDHLLQTNKQTNTPTPTNTQTNKYVFRRGHFCRNHYNSFIPQISLKLHVGYGKTWLTTV